MLNRSVHPGRILRDELTELDVSAAELARQIGVPANRVSMIIAGKRSISGDTALRLGHWFGQSAEFWMNLQAHHDLVTAREAVGDEIATLPTRKETTPA